MHETRVEIEKGDDNLQHQNGGDDVVCTRQVNKQTWYPLSSSDPLSKIVTQLVLLIQNLACVSYSRSTATKKEVESFCDLKTW